MNYIQFYHGLTPTKIHKEDKKEYISAIDNSRESNTNRFMAEQHLKTLKTEIRNHIKNSNKTNNFTLLF